MAEHSLVYEECMVNLTKRLIPCRLKMGSCPLKWSVFGDLLAELK